MSQLIMYLYCGGPASGKSTHVTEFMHDNPTYMLISPDLLRAHLSGGDMSDQTNNHYIFSALIPQHLRAAALSRMNVVFDATNYSRKNRKGIIEQARELGFKVVARVFKTPFEECVRRNEARERVVPLSVLERMRDGWQEPTEDEGFEGIEIFEWTPPEIPLDTPPQSPET